MPLSAGNRLGPYEILSPIGAGGMGEVYRARDTRLGRDVAVKVLPAEYSRDPERLRRFEQEARAASALNHPNILTVHDIGTQDETPYVVSELLEGETLRAKLGGPLSLRKTLDYSIGTANGLAAAHQKGIVHRDLKPENIFITRDGLVKILDFGLAKLTQSAAPPDPSTTPQANTATDVHFTEAGAILGTISYMSPEQASAHPVDFRSDQFSFGEVLYEMATGKQAFRRATGAETLVAIIREEPEPVAELNPRVPPLLRWLIERCLAKDPAERFGTTADLARDLEAISKHASEVSTGGSARLAAPPRQLVGRRVLMGTGFVLAMALAAGLGAWWQHSRAPAAGPQTPTIRYLTYSGHDYSPAASPDGRLVAFSSDRDGLRRIWLKEIATGGEVPLTTSGPDELPRFSPDGSMILFVRSYSLYRMSVLGGEPRKLADNALAGDWSPDGREIAFVRWRSREERVSTFVGIVGANGEGAREIAQVPNRALNFPRWSPDGRTIAAVDVNAPVSATFSGLSPTEIAALLGRTGIAASIALIPADGKQVRMVSPPPGGTAISALSWLSPDVVVYSQSESATGSAGRIIRHNLRSGSAQTILWTQQSSTILDTAGPGRLVFDVDPSSAAESLREFHLNGKTASAEYRWLTRGNSRDRQPVYSPDGEWVLFSSNRSGNLDLWEVSTKTGSLRRITDDPADDWDPAFSSDGQKIIWSSGRSGHLEIWMAEVDGSGARQVTHDGLDAENPTMSPDNAWIVYASGNPSRKGIWRIHPDGTADTRLVDADNVLPDVSPDGAYAAYTGTAGSPLRVARISDGTVLPFAVAGAFRVRWMPDGRAIAFTGIDEKSRPGIFVQDFISGQDTTRSRKALGGFDAETPTESFAISRDGSHLAIGSQEYRYGLMLAEHVPGINAAARPGL